MGTSVDSGEEIPEKKETISLYDRMVWALPEPLQSFAQANEYGLGIAWSCTGIIGFLLIYGLLQERIMKHPYNDGEMFTWSLFLVMANRLVTCAFNLGLLAKFAPSEMMPVAPLYKYALVSISNVVATFCQYEALRYVSFPLQTLGKTAKMIPVMLWGYMISGKKYGLKDYAVAVAVTAGCAVFVMYGDEFESKRKKATESSMYGIALMGGYLLFDGFTSTFQSKLFSGYNMSTYNQIFYVQACSAVFSGFSLASTGGMGSAISFFQRNPDALMHAFTLSGAATCSNLFISWTIKVYGALVFATIMTTRQFVSILASCVMFAHPLSWPGQYIGFALVFAALYYKAFKGKDKKEKVAASSSEKNDDVESKALTAEEKA